MSEGVAAETQERAQEYLCKLVGGVDRYFSEYLETSFFGNQDIKIISHLYHEDISCAHARTAEPSLEFRVEFSLYEDEPFSKRFAWRLPETQTYRMAQELIEWADDIFERDYSNIILPVFHIRYHEELMRAKDDDETRRVLLHAIRDVAAECTNLITNDWKIQNDPLLPYLTELALKYRKIIYTARKDGLLSIFHKVGNDTSSAWDIFRFSYEKTMKAYQGEDEQCINSPMGAMLMRAFLIITPREGQNNAWVASPFERNGVATVLHPSVLEMVHHHISYLFACFNYAAFKEWNSKDYKNVFHPTKWQDYIDLASIQMPLGGLIGDENLILDTQIRGQELIHRIGSPALNEAPLSTRLLLRYEGFDDEDITDADMFSETRESRLLENILDDYLLTHPHARDGISLAIYRNQDIQPVISSVHNFLCGLAEGNTPILSEDLRRTYSVAITIFTEAGEDAGVARWIEQWKERWEAADSEEKYAVYRHCKFSISHRVIPSQDTDRNSFARMIRDALDVDIAVLYDFIGAGLSGNEFQRVKNYDLRERTLKFPIIEKSFCMVEDPYLRLRRARVISNPQFRLASLHLETMARLKHDNTPPYQEHVLIGYGDFEPWQKVVDEIHKRAEWVVCIDPSIDDILIRLRKDIPDKEREIIGFGSGVGLHGELNFTISTEHFGLSDINYRLERAISELYPNWDETIYKKIAQSVINESQTLSGVSLVRATGVGNYLHDFMAYCLASKMLGSEDNLLCSHLISLDAYRHWFTQADQTRPDLLWLTASISDTGCILLDMHLIECKLAQENISHVDKAIRQIRNGLNTLIPAFLPRANNAGDDNRPDQRYWWLQLHRLIASKSRISRQRQDAIMAAMERLADGDYQIAWHAAALAFWTDSDSEELEMINKEVYQYSEDCNLKFGIYAMGRKALYNLCIAEKEIQLNWQDSSICFGDFRIHDKNDSIQKEDQKKPILSPIIITPEEKQNEILVTLPDENKSLPVIPTEPTRHIPERILLGKTVTGGKDVYWEFGHKQLANRHLLIFGTSGMGKTYAIQCLLCEMGQQGQNALIMDYTNGFLPNQLEKETKLILDPKQHIVRQAPLPISPFKLQVQDIGDGQEIPETLVSAAKRISGTFSQVYESLGDQQYSILLDAIIALIGQQNENTTLDRLLDILESFKGDGQHDKAKTLLTISKLKPFVLDKPFSSKATGLNWQSLFSDVKQRCHVFQFAGMDPISSRLVIEFALWDLNAFVRGTGNKNLPKVVVLDEAQNLDLSEQSPVSKYLTEGRKFGLSLILATQTMKNLHKDDKINRLFQAGHKLFFRPADTELQEHAKLMVQSVGGTISDWIANLSSLTKGQCYSIGPSLNTTTGRLETKPFKINITSLKERFSETNG